MALIVKIMSGEDMPDDDTRKSHRLLDGIEYVEFHRRPGAPVVRIVPAGDGAEAFDIDIEGNVYVMNAAGKTISSFGVAPPDPPKYREMLPGDMLQAVGDDASKWADAFAEHYPDIDREVVFGWFANAIENSWDVRCSRAARSDEAWADLSEQIGRHRAFWRDLDESPVQRADPAKVRAAEHDAGCGALEALPCDCRLSEQSADRPPSEGRV